MNIMGRALVTAQPEPVYTAKAPCLMEFWVSSDEIEDDEPTRVFVQWSEEMTDFNTGTPLEKGTKYTVPMAPGDTLFAITKNLALLGFMVTP